MKPFRRPRPTLSIADAWEEANAFLRAERGLVVPVTLAFLAIPTAIADIYGSLGDLTAGAGTILLLLASVFAQLFGTTAIAVLTLKPGLSVAEALRAALRRMGLVLGVAAIMFAVLLVFVLPVAPYFPVPGRAAVNPSGSAALYALIIMIGFFLVGARLSVALMVVAAEAVGPVTALVRSMRLTRAVRWRLLGFLLLFMVFSLIVRLAADDGVGSLLTMAGRLTGQEAAAKVTASLFSAVVDSGLTAWLIVVLARIYARLAEWNNGT